jgi:hypothetical protein
VNEAYPSLVDYKRMQWQNCTHYFGDPVRLAHARRHNLKRAGPRRVASEDLAAMNAPDTQTAQAGLFPERTASTN